MKIKVELKGTTLMITVDGVTAVRVYKSEKNAQAVERLAKMSENSALDFFREMEKKT